MRLTTQNAILGALLALPYIAHGADDLPTKRGLAFIGDHAPDIELLTSEKSQISWYYTWSTWPAEIIGDALTFVPLLHGISDAEDDELEDRLGRLPESSKHLLTFNEPDGEKDDGGSSISPEDAAEAYMSHIVRLREGKGRKWSISHPSVTGSPRGLDWLRSFNESCFEIDEEHGCPTDFVAVHWYGDAPGLKAWLDDMRDFYADLAPDAPLWVTELAWAQEDGEATLAMARESLEYLDGEDDVAAYAWFGAFRKDEANEWTGDEVALFDDDGGLTELGVVYLSDDEEKGDFEEGQKGDAEDAGMRTVPSWAVLGVVMGVAAVVSL